MGITETQVIQPGDHIRITVLSDDKTLSGEFEVAPDSTLKHPLYNQVKVGGIPVSMVKDRIASFLRRFQREPQLEVEPLLKVTVGGEVKAPGILFLAPETTIADAIARAGGATDRANLNAITISRGHRKIPVKLGENSGSEILTIQSGDQIDVAAQGNVMAHITPFVGIAASIVSLMILIATHR
jgi:protein involved in polysaccharide export with SLBB domain